MKKKPFSWQALALSVLLLLSLSAVFALNRKTVDSKALVEVTYPKARSVSNSYETNDNLPPDPSFITALKDFAYQTSPQVIGGSQKNINFSPVSLYYALTSATCGAQGESQGQLLALLGMAEKDSLVQKAGHYYQVLYRDNELGKTKIANSVWLDPKVNHNAVKFKDSYIRRLQDLYASCHYIDFAHKDSGEAMARWVSEETGGSIKPTVETQPDQVMAILNTVCYQAEWQDRFQENQTKQAAFTLKTGKQVSCDFMNQELHNAFFYQGEGFLRAGLNLKNSGKMIFILPEAGKTPQDLLKDADTMQTAFEGGKEYFGIVTWKVPKISFRSQLSLTDSLKELGLNSPFSQNADFSDLTDSPVFISNIGQASHLALNEKGVSAAAFTQIDLQGSAETHAKANMFLTKPFIFAIIDGHGVPLFTGICEDPSQP